MAHEGSVPLDQRRVAESPRGRGAGTRARWCGCERRQDASRTRSKALKNRTTVTYSEGDSFPFLTVRAVGAGARPGCRRDPECGAHIISRGIERDQRFRAMGIDYGPYFQGIREVWVGDGEALARVAIRDGDRVSSPLHAASDAHGRRAASDQRNLLPIARLRRLRIRLPFSAEAGGDGAACSPPRALPTCARWPPIGSTSRCSTRWAALALFSGRSLFARRRTGSPGSSSLPMGARNR